MHLEVRPENATPILDDLYGQLLKRGIQYFLPFSQLDVIGQARDSTPEITSLGTTECSLHFEWLGKQYALTNGKQFSDHERTMLRSIGRFLNARYNLLFNSEIAVRNPAIFAGLPEDRYVSAFLDRSVFDTVGSIDRLSRSDLTRRLKFYESALSGPTKTNESRLAHCCLDRCRMPVMHCHHSRLTRCPIRAS